ncbi:unnamed protein product [Owenia fusiformis]|uniref:Uncharacterized protein n=1 Tax=Owenia fusiformis TaxID=6347 RepID=A0A8J1UEC0_OWEFU|nr:unnamed protein product [Owenia fusiformis]
MHHQPPTIKPNWGKQRQKQYVPKSLIQQVLLHDNVLEKQTLDVSVRLLGIEHRRKLRLNELNKTSFILQQSRKQRQLEQHGNSTVSLIPEDVVRKYGHLAWKPGETDLDLPKIKSKSGSRRGSHRRSNTARDEIDRVAGANDRPGFDRSVTLPNLGKNQMHKRSVSVNDADDVKSIDINAKSLLITTPIHSGVSRMKRSKTFHFETEDHLKTSSKDPRFEKLFSTLNTPYKPPWHLPNENHKAPPPATMFVSHRSLSPEDEPLPTPREKLNRNVSFRPDSTSEILQDLEDLEIINDEAAEKADMDDW